MLQRKISSYLGIEKHKYMEYIQTEKRIPFIKCQKPRDPSLHKSHIPNIVRNNMVYAICGSSVPYDIEPIHSHYFTFIIMYMLYRCILHGF